ncbi:MAG: carboxypeptidase regulatory-like domain-containing protein [Gemmatimonadaceae bacterium]|nr:carboxypeptidase regulatory-like domain-containing protein [Gemmatimonadaceae bacterium]
MLARTTLASYVAFAVLVGGVLATPASRSTPPLPRSGGIATGVIAGTVRDTEGDPLGGALVELLGTDRSTYVGSSGRFLLDSVPAGRATVRITLQGYLPAQTELRVADDSATTLEVVLVPDGQPLAPVRIVGKSRGRIFGTVVDSVGTPLPGVSVGLVGTRGTTMTDSIGHFQFLDLAPGQYLVEARRLGFELSRYPVRMTDDLERVVTMRLRSGPMALTRIELHNTEVAAQEAQSRLAMRSMTKSFIMSREDLREFGRTPLDVVLARSAFRDYMRGSRVDAGALDTMCVLVDGWRALGRGFAPIDVMGGGGTRGKSSPNTGGWLRTFYADEVEMLEVHVSDQDQSRTLCGRFTYGTGCSCNPPYLTSPPTVVIWLKK